MSINTGTGVNAASGRLSLRGWLTLDRDGQCAKGELRMLGTGELASN